MKHPVTILLFLIMAACNQENTPHNEESAPPLNSVTPIDGNSELQKEGGKIVLDLFCEPIEKLNELFPNIRDTTIESEGVEWPGKIHYQNDGTWILFETSWIDQYSIWRVSTNSSQVKLQSPYQVGDEIWQIQDAGHMFTFNEGDGGQYFYFTGEDKDHIGFKVEPIFANEFYQGFYDKGLDNPMLQLNPEASIVQLIISMDCRNTFKKQE